jgi:polyhydroxyalkanoate synthesis repressor PhaR
MRVLSKADPPPSGKDPERVEPVVIKKYDLAAMVKSGRDFVVFDAKSGDDLTHSVLTQIIVEQESRMGGQTLLPIPFLRQLIRFYGDSIERMVPSYLQVSLETLAKEQERFRKTFADAFTPAGAFEAYQEQARKNLAMFEQAMAMFSPFSKPPAARQGGPEGEGPKPAEAAKPEPGAKPTPVAVSGARSEELDQLKSQLAAMQSRLDELSRKG